MAFQKAVTPVKTGVQGIRNDLKTLDSGLRRKDERISFFSSRWSVVVGRVSAGGGRRSFPNRLLSAVGGRSSFS